MVHIFEAVRNAHDDSHPHSPVQILKFFDCKNSAFKLQADASI